MDQIKQLFNPNSSIQSLYLSDKRIGVQGIQVLVEALKINTTLTKLDLWNSQIGPQGMQF